MGTAIHSAFAPCIPVHAMALGASLLDTMAHHPVPSNAGEGFKKQTQSMEFSCKQKHERPR
jgi:hypothetical protein